MNVPASWSETQTSAWNENAFDYLPIAWRTAHGYLASGQANSALFILFKQLDSHRAIHILIRILAPGQRKASRTPSGIAQRIPATSTHCKSVLSLISFLLLLLLWTAYYVQLWYTHLHSLPLMPASHRLLHRSIASIWGLLTWWFWIY